MRTRYFLLRVGAIVATHLAWRIIEAADAWMFTEADHDMATGEDLDRIANENDVGAPTRAPRWGAN